jgi:hypothetical protein
MPRGLGTKSPLVGTKSTKRVGAHRNCGTHGIKFVHYNEVFCLLISKLHGKKYSICNNKSDTLVNEACHFSCRLVESPGELKVSCQDDSCPSEDFERREYLFTAIYAFLNSS